MVVGRQKYVCYALDVLFWTVLYLNGFGTNLQYEQGQAHEVSEYCHILENVPVVHE